LKKVIIIGSGIAGIASAIRLSVNGYDVEVLEQSNKPGGKIREYRKDGFRFDMGPSLFTMPWLVDELFELCGEKAKASFSYSQLQSSCRYFFTDGQVVDAFQDKEKLVSELETKLGELPETIHRYLKDAEEIYHLLPKPLSSTPFRNPGEFRKSTSGLPSKKYLCCGPGRPCTKPIQLISPIPRHCRFSIALPLTMGQAHIKRLQP
jgi:phytoene dehydrogenase-like protein